MTVMKRTCLTFVLIAAFSLTSTACLHAQDGERENISQLSAALIKVSQAVHTTVLYKHPDPTLADAELLDAATSHNPALLDRFRDYTLKARQTDEKHSSVLVCTQDGTTALVEDAGCTGTSDWQAQETPSSCAFVLDLKAVCTLP